MQTLGQRLRAEREKKGLEVQELAGRTRIRAAYFEAIEADKPEEFPGPFFYRSFLRQYATLLELPQDFVESEVQRSLEDERARRAERGATAERQRPDVPPLPTGRTDLKLETQRVLSRLAVLLGVVALCTIVFLGWQRWGPAVTGALHRAFASTPTPSQPAKPATRPATATTTPPPAAPTSAQVPAQAQPAASNKPEEVKPPEPTPTEKKIAAAPNPEPTAGLAGSAIEIRTTADCWFDLWREGKHFEGVLLHAGGVKRIGAGGHLRLRFGNAGAVTATASGRVFDKIGPLGQPRTLDCDGAACALAAPRPAEPARPAQQ
jgi:cytoskeleton protein RodZ